MLIHHPFGLAFVCMSLLFVSGCKTVTDQNSASGELRHAGPFSALTNILTTSEKQKALDEARAQGLTLMDPARKADLDKIYAKVLEETRATKYSDNRVKIHSHGALLGSNDRSELDFFIRASAEVLNEGYDGFVIVHLDYSSPRPQLFSLTPNLTFSDDRWIGTYESFLTNRNEQNIFETRSGINRKVRDGVILLLNDEDFPNRDRFNASQIYMNLIEARFDL